MVDPNGGQHRQVSVTLLNPLGASGSSPLSRARSWASTCAGKAYSIGESSSGQETGTRNPAAPLSTMAESSAITTSSAPRLASSSTSASTPGRALPGGTTATTGKSCPIIAIGDRKSVV